MTANHPYGLTGAYALDALDAPERAAFEAHLASCAECREEVAGLREAAALLATTTWAAPPATLRARVLAETARTAQAVDGPDRAARRDGDRTDGRAPRHPASGSAATGPHRAWRWWVAAAAAVLVVVGVAAGSLAVRQHRADQALASAQAQMMDIATAPDAVSRAVALGTSHVVASDRMAAAALVGEDVPMPARAGMAYQLWMVHADGSTAPGPTFVPDHGRVIAIVEGDLSRVTSLRVTVEPRGGSPAPTGAVVATVSL